MITIKCLDEPFKKQNAQLVFTGGRVDMTLTEGNRGARRSGGTVCFDGEPVMRGRNKKPVRPFKASRRAQAGFVSDRFMSLVGLLLLVYAGLLLLKLAFFVFDYFAR